MTAQEIQTSVIPEAVLVTLQTLSPDRRQQVFDFVAFLAQQQGQSSTSVDMSEEPRRSPRRVLGQHKGMGWVSEDFNDPLPDEFWLGETGAENLSA